MKISIFKCIFVSEMYGSLNQNISNDQARISRSGLNIGLVLSKRDDIDRVIGDQDI